jgi:hypothetical protein
MVENLPSFTLAVSEGVEDNKQGIDLQNRPKIAFGLSKKGLRK